MESITLDRLIELSRALKRLKGYDLVPKKDTRFYFRKVPDDKFDGPMYFTLTFDATDRTIYVGDFPQGQYDSRCAFHGYDYNELCVRRDREQNCPFREQEKCPADELADRVHELWKGSQIYYSKQTRLPTLEEIKEEYGRKKLKAGKKTKAHLRKR